VPKIVAAILARQEAGPDRYLQRVLDNCASLCDDTVLVDDGSTDDTVKVARASGAIVSQFGAAAEFWGINETAPRAHLWALAAKVAGPGGWIYVADADHELTGITRSDLHILCSADLINGWAFPLYDCWDSDETHRVDGYWQAWAHPRVWLARAFPVPGWQPRWEVRGIHAGHLPGSYPVRAGVVPAGVGISHLGYISLRHRESKAARYLGLALPS
jgi:glycosyltransferase involved in cell wall biosynthesis